MEAIATQKFVRMNPRKLRLVADMVRKMKPAEALGVLPFVAQRAALPIEKVVKTAIANATQQGADAATLVFKEIQINEGTRMKRFRPVSRGRAHSYVKQLSHIRVIVETKEPAFAAAKPKAAEPKKEEVEDTKKEAKKTIKKQLEKTRKVKK